MTRYLQYLWLDIYSIYDWISTVSTLQVRLEEETRRKAEDLQRRRAEREVERDRRRRRELELERIQQDMAAEERRRRYHLGRWQ